ncbi:hypothetical protein [Paenibacillus sp. 481]|uniref:hypothetical protein n=1 Tax=Paenibacillus sp. 481 TaxID=2835869 RepID=UPI001E46EC9F|nr:hypothetical protein [Paenibacillus sp. 481]UHA73850.1 hypothetical protein KIK04_01385 [Paenibacillus sp. 481]
MKLKSGDLPVLATLCEPTGDREVFRKRGKGRRNHDLIMYTAYLLKSFIMR